MTETDKKWLLIAALLILTGCAHPHWHVLSTPQELACKGYGYCSPTAGMVVIGSTQCFTDDVTTADPINNADLRCHE